MSQIDEQTRTELEAAAFRRLVGHLRQRVDVQNIDLMNLAGFCRNCLSKWMAEEASARKIPLTLDEARTDVYGMDYNVWKQLHQRDATPDQSRAFAAAASEHAKHA